mgnify:CR=1 FL=1
MTTVEELQASRHFIVRLFDEMTKALPDGVYLTALEQKENRIELTGIAQSNARVSNFMRNIEESPWLENPKLSIIEGITKISDCSSNPTFSCSVD